MENNMKIKSIPCLNCMKPYAALSHIGNVDRYMIYREKTGASESQIKREDNIMGLKDIKLWKKMFLMPI